MLYDFSDRLRRRLDYFDNTSKSILENDPSNPFAHEWMASSYAAGFGEAEGNEEAITSCLSELSDAIKAAPENPRLFAKKGEAFAAIGELDSAVIELRRATEMNQNNIKLKFMLIETYIRLGRDYFVSALDVLNEIHSPAKIPLQQLLSAFFGKYGEVEEYEFFEHESSVLHKAHCLVLTGNTELALEFVNENLEHFDEFGEFVNLAEFYLCAEQFDKVSELLATVDEEQHPLGLLNSYISSVGESHASDVVVAAWENHEWNFTELLLFRDRLLRDHGEKYAGVVGVFEEIVKVNAKTIKLVDENSVFFRRTSRRRRVHSEIIRRKST